MAILNNNPLVGASGNQGGYNINNSLRFRSSATAYLSRTFSSSGTIDTWSFWVKRGTLGTAQNIFGTSNGTNQSYGIEFTSSDTLQVFDYLNSYRLQLNTTQVFRDPSAWYHIVVGLDTTQATSSNRCKVYVNGTQVTAFGTATYPTQNTSLNIGSSASVAIGVVGNVGGQAFDGYLADFNFIDGQALTPSSFGETDTTTGVWKPKAYTGTYGTNGFYLKFSDIATTSGSNAGLGKDFSGNSNYWTTNNISVTSGTTYDAMTDSPTNTSATVANYAVLNPLNKGASLTVSDGNLYADATTTTVATTYSTLRIDTATYWENYISATDAAGYPLIGAGIGTSTGGVTGAGSWSVGSDGYTYLNGTSANAGYTFTSTDIIQCAYDPVTGKFWLGKNNTWFGSGNPSTGANPVATISTSNQIYALVSHYGNSNSSANFGQRPFAYTPPTGFVALNTFNLPTPTILQGNKYMDATLYTGNGATRSITNDGSFKPDFVWIKARSIAYYHRLADSVRGTGKELYSNDTLAETTNQADGYVSAFNSNGFSILGGAGVNLNANTFVAWQWQAGQGSTSSNTSGSITSTVSVNTTAGFSIVTYTGTGSVATVGHGLGVAPRMVIVKSRSAGSTDWVVYHASLGATQNVRLQSTAAAATQTVMWNDTAPTSTVFTIGTNNNVNTNAQTQVAYCWAEIAGFSRFGSYTGNGSADGTFVYTGFRPKFVVIKVSSTTNSWEIFDTSRDTYNASGLRLFAESSSAEVDSRPYIDILSNGFKLRSTGTGINGSGSTYIFMAFAEHPFKNSLAR